MASNRLPFTAALSSLWVRLGFSVGLMQFLRRQNVHRLRWLVGLSLNGLLVALFVLLLYRNKAALPLIVQVVSPLNLGACLLLYLASLLLQFSVWRELMDYRHGERGRALEEYTRTILMGRLPGGLWKLVGRMTIYRAPRLSSANILIINVIELCLALLANAIIMLFLVGLSGRISIAIILSIFVALSLFALYVPRLLPALHQVHNPIRWIQWIGSYIVSWCCGGLIIYLVIVPFDPSVTLTSAIRYWCTAGAVGLILQMVPLSMLISDATLVALLRPSMSLSNAFVATFAVRLMMMTCELATGWFLLVVAGRIQRASSYTESRHEND